jgi:mRNA interferase MazF
MKGKIVLIQPSTIRLDHLVTLRQSMVRRELGSLNLATQHKIAETIANLVQP